LLDFRFLKLGALGVLAVQILHCSSLGGRELVGGGDGTAYESPAYLDVFMQGVSSRIALSSRSWVWFTKWQAFTILRVTRILRMAKTDIIPLVHQLTRSYPMKADSIQTSIVDY
jgi:hypothetical protein